MCIATAGACDSPAKPTRFPRVAYPTPACAAGVLLCITETGVRSLTALSSLQSGRTPTTRTIRQAAARAGHAVEIQ